MRRLPFCAASSIGLSAASMPGTASAPARKAEKPRGRSPLLPDDKILELRALAEFAGWDAARLAERFGVDLPMVKRILSGITRARLVATRAHLPVEVAR